VVAGLGRGSKRRGGVEGESEASHSRGTEGVNGGGGAGRVVDLEEGGESVLGGYLGRSSGGCWTGGSRVATGGRTGWGLVLLSGARRGGGVFVLDRATCNQDSTAILEAPEKGVVRRRGVGDTQELAIDVAVEGGGTSAVKSCDRGGIERGVLDKRHGSQTGAALFYAETELDGSSSV